MRLRVRGGRPLAGEGRAPPDKSVVHRALILGALGAGPHRVEPLGAGADNLSTLRALRGLGVEAHVEDGAAVVEGVSAPSHLERPDAPLDCGNSGTTLRLLAGVTAAAPGLRVLLDGDASLRRRPMERLRPLEAMGARLGAASPLGVPLVVEGARLRGRRHELKVASAQVKSALLLAGLFAEGPTTVVEPRRSRDHTERMLLARGVDLTREDRSDGAHVVRVAPLEAPWSTPATEPPPDVSSAAFLLAAAAVTGGEVALETGVNPTRTGVLDVLEAFGAQLSRSAEREVGGEPRARVRCAGGSLRGGRVDGELALRSLDELPLLAGVALFADGETVIADAAELRVKESDRVEATARVARAFGGEVETRPDGLVLQGGARLGPARVDAEGDHRIAMTAAIVALGIEGESVIEGADVIGVSFPDFAATLRDLGAQVEVDG
jgi:3-phosphoshikimate 1-carboxyvinyltransferase